MKPRLSHASALTAAVLVAVGTTPAPAQADGTPSVAGADLISASSGGDGLDLTLRDAGGAEHEPERVTLGPDGGLAGRVPDDPAWGFLGAPGQPVWSLAEGGSGFPAVDTTGVRAERVRLSLRSVEGPGAFAVYTVDRWGRPSVLLDSDGGGAGAPAAVLPGGTRTHGLAWTFDTPGTHRVTLAVEAGGQTAEATYRVEVPVIRPPGAARPFPAAAAPRAAAATVEPSVSSGTPEAAAGTTVVTTAGERKVIADGHVDMGPQLNGDAWTIRLRDDTVSPAVWRELGDVVLHVTDRAKITVPAGADHGFLGGEGDPVWLLPQSQQSGIVWPGWNTQHESVVSGVRGEVTWTLKGVSGPGDFALFLTGSFGRPQVLFDSGRTLPQRLAIPLNTHAHGNWAFTEPGLYRLAVEMSATTSGGKAVTDTRTLTVAVGDGTDPGGGFTGGGGSSAGGSGTGSPGGGRLATTGSAVIGVIGTAFGLLGAGVTLRVLARRRTRPSFR